MKAAPASWLPDPRTQPEDLIREARRRQRRRWLAAGVAGVVMLAGAAGVAAGLAGHRYGRASSRGHPGNEAAAARAVAQSGVPRYYMALVPTDLKVYAEDGVDAGYAAVKDSITGQTVATVRPPRPYIEFIGVTGAADDRTFVLTAQSTLAGSQTLRDKFFYARFSPAGHAVTLTPLALTGLPVSNDLPQAALSPDGTRLAVASFMGPVQITVYSLPGGAARTWTARPRASRFTSDVTDFLSWSRAGILAFGWGGSGEAVLQNGHTVLQNGRLKLDKSQETPPGEYLLNTNTPGGSLLADSRDASCVPQPLPTGDYRGLGSGGYLTPDGATIISVVPQPIPIGQRPPSCSHMPGGGPPPTMPELEEFSATTGQATRVLYTSRSHGALAGDVYWSNASGSVLIVEGKLTAGPESVMGPWVFGILRGSTFTPIPGAVSPPLTLVLAF
jgi:hypothetical protein